MRHETPSPIPLPGEVHLKFWLAEEAKRQGVDSGAITMRIRRGKYPALKIRKAGPHTQFVKL